MIGSRWPRLRYGLAWSISQPRADFPKRTGYLSARPKWSKLEVFRGLITQRCLERSLRGSGDVLNGPLGTLNALNGPFETSADVPDAPFAASGPCRWRFAPAREAGRTVATVPHDQPRKTSNSDH